MDMDQALKEIVKVEEQAEAIVHLLKVEGQELEEKLDRMAADFLDSVQIRSQEAAYRLVEERKAEVESEVQAFVQERRQRVKALLDEAPKWDETLELVLKQVWGLRPGE